MSSAVAKAKAAMAEEEGKLKKLFKQIKKFFAKEFLWVLMVFLLSVPLALILRYAYCEIAPNEVEITVDEMLNGNSLLIAAYGVSVAGIYFTRTTVGAIKTLTKKNQNRMIDKALTFIRNHLNQEFKNSMGLDDSPVAVSSLVNPDGSVAAEAQNKIVISIINLEHETAVKSYQNYYREDAASGYGSIRPPVFLNMYLLISANHDASNYLEANKRLSKVISIFQGHSFFTKQEYPQMAAPLQKLTFELYNLPINELSHIWSGIGAKYVPSIIYKVRMLTLEDDRIRKEIPGITGLESTSKANK